MGVCIIAMESTPEFGSDHTSRPLRWLVQLFCGHIGDATWEVVHHLARKTGHFLGYGALGLTWLRAWRRTLPKTRFLAQAALALVGTVLVASCDEWHQTFLPNRTGSPWDVLLDSFGAAILFGATWIFLRRLPRTQQGNGD